MNFSKISNKGLLWTDVILDPRPGRTGRCLVLHRRSSGPASCQTATLFGEKRDSHRVGSPGGRGTPTQSCWNNLPRATGHCCNRRSEVPGGIMQHRPFESYTMPRLSYQNLVPYNKDLSRERHLHSLTPLRGVAALWVVFYHYGAIYFPYLQPERHTHVLQKGYLAVDLFFFCLAALSCPTSTTSRSLVEITGIFSGHGLHGYIRFTCWSSCSFLQQTLPPERWCMLLPEGSRFGRLKELAPSLPSRLTC